MSENIKASLAILVSLLLLLPIACKKPAPAGPAANPPPISLTAQRTIFQCPGGEFPLQTAITASGRLLYAACSDQNIYLIKNPGDTSTPSVSQGIRIPALPVHALVSPDGQLLAAVAAIPPTIELLSLPSLAPARKPIPIPSPDEITQLLFSPDSQTLAAAIAEPDHHRVELLSMFDGQPRVTIALASAPSAMAYAPDGSILAIANGNILHIVDALNGTAHPTTMLYRERPSDTLAALAFSSDNITLATYFTDGNLGLWNTATQEEQKTRRHFQRVQAPLQLSFSPDGRFLAINADNQAQILNAKTLQTVATLSNANQPITSFIFSPVHAQLYTGDKSGVIRQWDLSSLR